MAHDDLPTTLGWQSKPAEAEQQLLTRSQLQENKSEVYHTPTNNRVQPNLYVGCRKLQVRPLSSEQPRFRRCSASPLGITPAFMAQRCRFSALAGHFFLSHTGVVCKHTSQMKASRATSFGPSASSDQASNFEQTARKSMHIADDKVVKRIVVADDFPEMLDAVVQCLAPDHEVVGRVSDGLALVECACRLQPDLLVTDLAMPKLNGFEALRRLRHLGVHTPAIVLTVDDNEDFAKEALSVGAQGFVLKSRMGSDLRLAVREVLAGRTFIAEIPRKKLPKPRRDGHGNRKDEARVGPRAAEILLDRSGLLISRTKSMKWAAGPAPGCCAKPLFVEKQHNVVTSLVRMDAGTRFPAHRHHSPEELFLLEGDIVIEGQKLRPGDYSRAETGSTHCESYTESGCLFLLKASRLNEVIK